MADDYFTVRELLDLPRNERLTECSRCGEYQHDVVQLRAIGSQVALCATCLRRLARLASKQP